MNTLSNIDHEYCGASTGIHESDDADGSSKSPWGLTYGSGRLDEYGYWSIPCGYCARLAEIRDGVCIDSYWPFQDKEAERQNGTK